MTTQTIAQIAIGLSLSAFVAMFIWAFIPPGKSRENKKDGR